MKRVLAICMVLFLLVGCSRTDPVPAEPETPPTAEQQQIEAVEPIPEPEPIPVPEPETIPAPEPIPEPEQTAEPEQLPVSEPVPEEPVTQEEAQTPAQESGELAEAAAAVYREITEGRTFHVWILEPDGTVTKQTVEPGRNDWNVASREYVFGNYLWTEATEEEWNELERSETRGNRLDLSEPGEWGVRNLFCYSGGDLVCLVDETEVRYLRAVNPREGEQFEWKLYGALEIIAQDAMSREVLYVTVDGSLSPQEAAGRMAEKIAENYRSVPGWVVWKPVSVKAERAEVYDLYRGTPEEFCFNLGLGVKVTDPMAREAAYWQVGSGLGEPDENGFCGWGREVLVRKDDEGNWSVLELGTGGSSVAPEWPAGKPWAAWLVELFCLTEGITHDRLVPVQLLSLTSDQMAALPELLDQLTEAESRELCSALGALLRQEDRTWEYTVETLKPLLGDYGVWLDA